VSNVDRNLAGGGTTMSVEALGPLHLETGEDQVEHRMYVAPLQDDMLLDIEFLNETRSPDALQYSLTIQLLHKGETPLGGVVAVR
jgi:hypothetical protein